MEKIETCEDLTNGKNEEEYHGFCCSLICIAGVTFLVQFVGYIHMVWLRIAALVGINLLNG